MLKKCICTVLAAGVLFSNGLAFAEEYPVDTSGIKAAVVMEQSSGKVVLDYNADEKMETGGLSRLPVLLAVCNKIDSEAISLTDKITVSPTAAKVNGPTAFLEAYEQMEVSSLLKAAVMICAGDATYALGEGIYGSAEASALAVNNTMADMGVDAAYTDITGNGVILSATEIARIGAALMQSRSFLLYSGLYYDNIQHTDGRVTELASSNKLLKSCVGANGVGTGSSSAAGYCGVFSVKRGNTGYICAVLGAQNSSHRAEKAQSMLEYAFAAYDVKILASEGDVIEHGVPVKSGTAASVPLIAKETGVALIPKNAKLQEFREVPEILEAPLSTDEVVGKITYTLDGETAGEVELVCAESVERANAVDYIRMSLLQWLHC